MITFKNKEMPVNDIDLQMIAVQQAHDLAEIETLKQQIELMDGNLTVADISMGDIQLAKDNSS